MHLRVEQQQLQQHFVIAHRVRQRQFALVRRLTFELHAYAHLIRREGVSVQSGAELMQQSRENKREWLELSDGMLEFKRMRKDRCGLFNFQVPLGFAGCELLKFYSAKDPTFGNA